MAKRANSRTDSDSLAASAKAGSADAFEKIVEEYRYPIIRYLYRLTSDYETARDLTQDTFVSAYKNIAKTNGDLNLSAWLYKIATNYAMKYHRRKKIVSFIPIEKMNNPIKSGNGTHPEDTIEEITIRETLKKIPYDQRICIVLYYVEGFKYREIANTIGISEDAVRKRVSRGVQVFRRLYNGGNGR